MPLIFKVWNAKIYLGKQMLGKIYHDQEMGEKTYLGRQMCGKIYLNRER